MFNSTNIAIKIIEYAKSQGISQKYICDQLSLAPSYLLNIKNGKDRMTPDRLAKIAEILHTTPEYLMDETDDPAIADPAKDIAALKELHADKSALIRLILDIDDPKIIRAAKVFLAEIQQGR